MAFHVRFFVRQRHILRPPLRTPQDIILFVASTPDIEGQSSQLPALVCTDLVPNDLTRMDTYLSMLMAFC